MNENITIIVWCMLCCQ